jgi:hypothetical protein
MLVAAGRRPPLMSKPLSSVLGFAEELFVHLSVYLMDLVVVGTYAVKQFVCSAYSCEHTASQQCTRLRINWYSAALLVTGMIKAASH